MKEEEKKAIEVLKQIIEKSRDLREEDFYSLIGIHQIQAISTILNLIEKQQKELEKNKNFIDFLQSNDVKKLGEIIKKDKIIDLMAEKIYEEGIVWDNKEEVKQYFENKAKEVKI